jgi:hypothetical protein
MITLHEATSQSKIKDLESSLEEKGWIGAPLVLIDDNGYLLTGTHRFIAAQNLGWIDLEIPTIFLEEVFEEDGKDFETTAQEWDYPTPGNGVFYQMITSELSEEIREKYGIDCN